MNPSELKFRADPIPGVLSISSNIPVIPSYPLIRQLAPIEQDNFSTQCELNINYIVTKEAASKSAIHGKTFAKVDNHGVRLETPVGNFGRLSQFLQWENKNPTLKVNKTFHRLAKVTIGNVHSVGWLMRDLTNITLLTNGYALLHAAAIKHKERVVVIFGLSNTGKTKTVFSLVKDHNTQFYGDDLVLSDGSSIYACPNTGANVDPDAGPGLGYKIEQYLRRGLPFFENFAGTLSYSISDALGVENIAAPSPVTDIIIMRNSNTERLETIEKHRAADLLLASNRTEFTFGSNALLSAAEYFETGVETTTAITNEGTILQQLAENASCHFAEGDYNYLGDIVKDILQIPRQVA